MASQKQKRTKVEPDKRVDATPAKQFFISMLVKDIELLPAVIDLVDNSVDGARSLRPDGHYADLKVVIEVNADRFAIEDNCGGIDTALARRYAFRFGRPEGFKGIQSSVGQFGVGMKRALFKMGQKFSITSAAPTSRFTMTVDVAEWASDEGPDWSFEFDTVEEGIAVPETEWGTTIEVDPLHPSVSEDFGRTEVVGKLRSQIAMKHQSALAGGLSIIVNGKSLETSLPALLASDEIKPINKFSTIPVNGQVVESRIYAGIASAKERDEYKDEGEAQSFRDPGEAGWYVYCNDRLVLERDRSELTGWGTATAAYHPQYRRFRGYVFLTSKDSSLLPWNTTKTGLDQDSMVFRRVQQEMFVALANVVSVLNRLKSERQKGGVGPISTALEESAPTHIADLPQSEAYVAPPPPPRPPRTPPSEINVSYRASREDMEKVMKILRVTSAARAGQMTFEYFVRAEVDEVD